MHSGNDLPSALGSGKERENGRASLWSPGLFLLLSVNILEVFSTTFPESCTGIAPCQHSSPAPWDNTRAMLRNQRLRSKMDLFTAYSSLINGLTPKTTWKVLGSPASGTGPIQTWASHS